MKILNIVCPGHSGSTLLTMCLNSHPDIIFFGEFSSIHKRLLLKEQRKDNFLCSFCISDQCPIFNKEHIKILENLYSIKQTKLSKLKNYLSFYRYLNIFSKLQPKRIIGDNSKSAKWFLRNHFLTNLLHDSYYVVLKRNKFGVANSILSKGLSLQETKKILNEENIDIKKLLKILPKKKVIRVDYENFIKDPKSTLIKICNKLNLGFSDKTLKYRKFEHHFIGGNLGTMVQANKKYSKKNNKIEKALNKKNPFEEDVEWKTNLSQSQYEFISNEINIDF